MWILFGALCLKMGAVCQNCICLFPDADLLATLPTAYLTGPDQPRDVPCYFRKPNRIVKSPFDIDTYTILHYEEGTSRYIKVPQVPSVQKFRWELTHFPGFRSTDRCLAYRTPMSQAQRLSALQCLTLRSSSASQVFVYLPQVQNFSRRE